MIKRFVRVLIVCQIIVIIFLGYFISNKSTRSQKISINNLKFIYYEQIPDIRFEYYDFIPNKTVEYVLFSENSSKQYNINSDSLSEKKEYLPDKPQNTFRIITLGDSFTFGLHVDQSKNYSKILEEKLNKKCNQFENYEVINFGVPGYDLRFEADKFINKGIKYNPNMVIWWLDIVDVTVLESDLRSKYREIFPGSHTLKTHEEQYNAGHQYKQVLGILNKEKGINYYHQKSQETLIEIGNKIPNTPKIIIGEPESMEYIKSNILNASLIDNLKFSTLPIKPSINNTSSLHFDMDHHPNEVGHLIIAAKIFNHLKEVC